MAHRVERVRDDNQRRLPRPLRHLARDRTGDAFVRRDEVVPAHVAGAWDAGGDHDELGALRLVVAVRADDVWLVREHGPGLVQVECLALGQPLLDVDQDDVGVVAARDLLGDRGADVTGAYNGDLASRHQTRTPIRSMTASATSLVPTAVGS